MTNCSLLFIDDHPLFRQGLVFALGAAIPDMAIRDVDRWKKHWAYLIVTRSILSCRITASRWVMALTPFDGSG